jgi:hypothetical protein
MSKHKHIIYIPGIGDTTATWQKRAVKTWMLWGVTPHTFQMIWADGEAFEPKFKRLLGLIDECAKDGSVSLVCASAGASAAIPAFAARKDVISGLVCIAGKIHHPGAIGGAYRSRNPAFVEGAHLVADALQELKDRHGDILSIRSAFDPIVPARDSILRGAHNRMTMVMGHAATIGTQLLFGAPRFLRFLKDRSK